MRGEPSGARREVDLNGLVEEALNLAYHCARAQDQNFSITLERDPDDVIAPIELVPQDMTGSCSTCSASASTPPQSASATGPSRTPARR